MRDSSGRSLHSLGPRKIRINLTILRFKRNGGQLEFSHRWGNTIIELSISLYKINIEELNFEPMLSHSHRSLFIFTQLTVLSHVTRVWAWSQCYISRGSSWRVRLWAALAGWRASTPTLASRASTAARPRSSATAPADGDLASRRLRACLRTTDLAGRDPGTATHTVQPTELYRPSRSGDTSPKEPVPMNTYQPFWTPQS